MSHPNYYANRGPVGAKISAATKRVLKYLEARQAQSPPAIRDIAQGVGLASSSSVNYHLIKLEHAGYITRERDGSGLAKPRSILLTSKARVTVPIRGTLDAKGIHLD